MKLVTPATRAAIRLSRRLSQPAWVGFAETAAPYIAPTSLLQLMFSFVPFESAKELADLELVCRTFKKSLDLKYLPVQLLWMNLLRQQWGDVVLTTEEVGKGLNLKHIYERRYLQCLLPLKIAEKERTLMMSIGDSSVIQESRSALLKYSAQREIARLQHFLAVSRGSDPRKPVVDRSGENEAFSKDLVSALWREDDFQIILNSVVRYRHLLSVVNNPNIQSVVEAGVVPRFVELLRTVAPQHHTLRFELIWVLTNICSGTTDHVRTVVEAGAIPLLVDAIRDTSLRVDDIVVEQAVWCLGNISGDSAAFNELVADHEPIPALMLRLTNVNVPALRSGFLRNLAWFFSNCVRSRPRLPFWRIKRIVQIYGEALRCGEPDVLCDSLWGLSYITQDASSDEVMFVSSIIGAEQLLGLLALGHLMVTSPLLLVLRNLCKSLPSIRSELLKAGMVEKLVYLAETRVSRRLNEAIGKIAIALVEAPEFSKDGLIKLFPSFSKILPPESTAA